jgi:hypothetical protein
MTLFPYPTLFRSYLGETTFVAGPAVKLHARKSAAPNAHFWEFSDGYRSGQLVRSEDLPAFKLTEPSQASSPSDSFLSVHADISANIRDRFVNHLQNKSGTSSSLGCLLPPFSSIC